MFSNFAWSEMLVIAAVAIIVVGPKDLPGMLRQLGKAIGSVKRMAGDFQQQFNDALKETELDELKDMTSVKGFDPLEDARKSMEEMQKSIQEPFKDPMEPDPQVEVAPPKKIAAKKPATKKPAARKAAPKKASTTKTAQTKTAAKPKAAAKTAAKKTAPRKRTTTAKKPPAAKSDAT